MRDALAPLEHKRRPYTATFERKGRRTVRYWNGYSWKEKPSDTLLLVDVRDRFGKVVADHVWMTDAKCWNGIEPGDRISFEARVTTYRKVIITEEGERYTSEDYKFANPTHVRRAVRNETSLTMPLTKYL